MSLGLAQASTNKERNRNIKKSYERKNQGWYNGDDNNYIPFLRRNKGKLIRKKMEVSFFSFFVEIDKHHTVLINVDTQQSM